MCKAGSSWVGRGDKLLFDVFSSLICVGAHHAGTAMAVINVEPADLVAGVDQADTISVEAVNDVMLPEEPRPLNGVMDSIAEPLDRIGGQAEGQTVLFVWCAHVQQYT